MTKIAQIPNSEIHISFLFSILIHLLILSIPFYFPETKYFPVFELTPVELLDIEPTAITKKYKLKEIKHSLSEISSFNQIKPKTSSFKGGGRELGGKDFGKINVLDSKKSDILIKKESFFIPSEKKDYGPTGAGTSNMGSNMVGIGEKDIMPGVGEGDDKLTPYSFSLSKEGESEYGFDFGGTIGKRGVRSKPSQKPAPEVDKEVIIILKFWVTPSGQVFDVAPEKKGDAYLEKVAIDYLRKWTFDLLPSNVVQENQWGIIPVRFEKK